MGQENINMPFDWSRVAAAWLDFLFGCPRRTLKIALVVLVLFLICYPAILVGLAAYVVNEMVAPLFEGLLPWFLLAAFCFWLWSKAKPKGGGRKK